MQPGEVMVAIRALAEEHRATCLWFLREDHVPATREEALRVLDGIEHHGGLSAFRRARELRQWLLHPSSASSAGSLADQRKRSGESYVAGGVALNELVGGARRSRDIDLFHDTGEALRSSWDSDRQLLTSAGYLVEVIRERPMFVEALIHRGGERVIVEWSHDSAYRYFPLVEHDVLGLTMHPLDLATNKLLALIGRREPRDYVDVLLAAESIQPLGYLAWAASGKDPGFSPRAVLEEATRSARYTQADLDALDFSPDAPPDAAVLSRRWHAQVAEARDVVDRLPAEHAGTCVIDSVGALYRAGANDIENDVRTGGVAFHQGRIRGSFPRIIG